MIAAIILAAGSSSRMGRPKALLPYAGTTFLGRILDLYSGSGVGKIVVVLWKDDEALRAEIPAGDATAVFNLRPEGGQISSLVAGIAAVESLRPSAIVVHPVDHPAVAAATVRGIVSSALVHPGRIVVPVCAGRRGHPVVFPSSCFRELQTVPPGQGARTVTRANSSMVLEMETEDEGILKDIDTPEEYARLR
jgi:molybdenum cofactor cytidylyltransferase